MLADTKLVYFLFHKSEPCFKIGTTGWLASRLRHLPDPVNIQRSVVVECLHQPASEIEALLHKTFAEFQVQREPGTDGYTEWFHVDCFPEIAAFLEASRRTLGCSEFRPVEESLCDEENPMLVQLRLPKELIQRIDKARKTRTVPPSRHSWILEALLEKMAAE